jgi:hypothetical protein
MRWEGTGVVGLLEGIKRSIKVGKALRGTTVGEG